MSELMNFSWLDTGFWLGVAGAIGKALHLWYKYVKANESDVWWRKAFRIALFVVAGTYEETVKFVKTAYADGELSEQEKSEALAVVRQTAIVRLANALGIDKTTPILGEIVDWAVAKDKALGGQGAVNPSKVPVTE